MYEIEKEFIVNDLFLSSEEIGYEINKKRWHIATGDTAGAVE